MEVQLRFSQFQNFAIVGLPKLIWHLESGEERMQYVDDFYCCY